MTKKRKIYIVIIICIIAGYFIWDNMNYFYKIDKSPYTLFPITSKENKYDFLFKDSLVNSFSVISAFGNKENYTYMYSNKDFRVIIWEIKGLSDISMDSIFIKSKKPLEYDSYNKNTFGKMIFYNGPTVNLISKYKLSMKNQLFISLIDRDPHCKSYMESNYYYLYGSFKDVVFSNKQNESQIKIEYKHFNKTGILFLKENGKVYILIINSISAEALNVNEILDIIKIKTSV